ncbi:hypothetical protein P7H01_05455 [Enterococcus thailandicus]|uniref:hypothetical protein n=1 Tax=Enterococcus thailandicus TaxID=417368 RepID=UPI00288FDA15|nr:hypothetical protein [Enterococcus thailandicus]MDT2751503.1 hypothetical protein [Enterococcus thailandicus]
MKTNIWEIISSVGTLLAVVVALLLPAWERRTRVKVKLLINDDKMSYLIENRTNRDIRLTSIDYILLQKDGLYYYNEWRSYNFYKKDKMNDDFGITWNEEYKKKQYEYHNLKEMEHIIKEKSKITLGFMQRYKTKSKHSPNIEARSLVLLKIVIHTGKTFYSNPVYTKIYKNTEMDPESINYRKPKDENYYEEDRFGNVIHEPPSRKK